MLREQRVFSVLIVSAAEKFCSSIRSLLAESKFSPVDCVSNAGQAKRKLIDRNYDIVIINSPLPDEFGYDFAIDVSSSGGTVCLLFAKQDIYAEVHDKTEKYGVLVLPKPTSTQMISQALDWACAIRERLKGVEKKTATVEEKMAEIRLVNRAKWLLINELKMTENEAHRYIEKQSMDRCVSRKEFSEQIIKTYA